MTLLGSHQRPNSYHDLQRRPRKRFQKVAEYGCRSSSYVVSLPIHLLNSTQPSSSTRNGNQNANEDANIADEIANQTAGAANGGS